MELLPFVAFPPDVTAAVRPARTDVREEFPAWNLLMREGRKSLQSDAVAAGDSAGTALPDKRVHVFAKCFGTTHTLVDVPTLVPEEPQDDGENVKYLRLHA